MQSMRQFTEASEFLHIFNVSLGLGPEVDSPGNLDTIPLGSSLLGVFA